MLGHRKLDVDDYFSILKRRWWILVIPAVILSGAAYASTFFIPAQYLSQALILIESQHVSSDYVNPVVDSDLDGRLTNMTAQTLSRSKIQPIVERYNLYATSHMTMDDRVAAVTKDVIVKPIHSDLNARGLPGFTVSFKASDARSAQLVCAEITGLFISENEKISEDATAGTQDFLKGQLEDAKKNLNEQDAKLAEFQRQNQFVGSTPGEGNSNVSMLSSLNTQLEATTQALSALDFQKSNIEAAIAQQQFSASAEPGPLPGNAPSQSGSAASAAPNPLQTELQALQAQETELLTHYTADYPDVVQIHRKIAEVRKEIARAPLAVASSSGGPVASPARAAESPILSRLRGQQRAIDVQIDEKKREQMQLQNSLRTYQGRIAQSPLIEEQYKEITRGYQTALGFYNSLLAEMNKAKMATDLQNRQQGTQFRIQDSANLPDSPTFPKPILFTFGGLVLGIAFGLGIIAILEYKDTTLQNEKDVWAFTKLPTLAVIAYLPENIPSVKRGLLSRLNPFSRKQQLPQS